MLPQKFYCYFFRLPCLYSSPFYQLLGSMKSIFIEVWYIVLEDPSILVPNISQPLFCDDDIIYTLNQYIQDKEKSSLLPYRWKKFVPSTQGRFLDTNVKQECAHAGYNTTGFEVSKITTSKFFFMTY